MHLARVTHGVVDGRQHIDALHAKRQDADEDGRGFEFGVVNVAAC